MRSVRDMFPLRLIIGQEDCTFLLADGFTFSNVDPGGFEAASFNIPRDMPNTLRGQYVRIDCGLRVAWEGRVSQIQRSLGNNTSISCEGYGALLADNDYSEVFIDRDLTRWQTPSVTRQIAVIGNGNNISEFSWTIATDSTNGIPGLVFQGQGQLSGKPQTEAWYDAGPQNAIALVRVDSGNALGFTFPDANVSLHAERWSDDAGDGEAQSSNFASASPTLSYSPSAARYISFYLLYNAAGPSLTAGKTYGFSLQNISLIGNHGLALRGTTPNDGYYPSDLFGWLIGQIPGLQTGVIQTTDSGGFILPHSVYYTPVGGDQIAADMSTSQGWHWGVWESQSPLTGNALPRADFRPRAAPGAATAFCRRSDCDQLDIREDLAQQYNQATITFTDVTGVEGAVTVGLDNPILDAAGIAERTVTFDGGLMNPATAALFGVEALTILSFQARVAGSADIITPIDGPSGPMPAWLLKAGIDRLRIGDLPSTDAFGAFNDVPISRVECSGSSSGFNTSVEIGTGADLVETLQSRLNSATALAGQGG